MFRGSRLSLLLILLLIPCFAALSGCGGVSGTTITHNTPVITFTASPTTINAGDTAVLTWQVTNASSVSIDQGIGTVPAQGSHNVKPQTTSTYTLTAIGADGPVTATATVTVNAAGGGGTSSAPTIQLTADQTSITSGQAVTLSWTSTNATSISIDQGIGTVAVPSGTYKVTPTATTTYTATATGAGGTTTASVVITVTAPAPPTIISFTASPSTINQGGVTTLTWKTANATSVSLSPAIPAEDGQPLPVSGSATPTLNQTTTYTLTASGPGGSNSTATVTVTVNVPPPTITLTATPTSVPSGGISTLSWSSQNATKITIDNGVGSVTVPSGKQDVTVASTTTYTATATGSNGATATAQATVTVNPLDVKLTADKMQIGLGDSTTLTWTSQGASSVDIEPGLGQVALNDSAKVSPSQTTTYTATAKDSSGNTKTAQVTITVVPGGSFSSSIKHIIFFVQENRSFDNYFGMLGNYKANHDSLPNDVDGLDPSTMVQYDDNGVAVHPYHQATICAENTSPSWNPSWKSYDNGAMDGFIKAHDLPTTIDPQYHRVMAYYDNTDLPYYYELAAQFATSDRWFSPVLSATIPNRMYLFAATSAGHIYPDAPPSGGWPMQTIFQLLQSHGISWRYYYMDNSIFLGQWAAWQDPAIRDNVRNISEYYNILNDPNADNLLPQVIFIERASSTGLDEHPDNNTQKGAAVGEQIINALLKSAAWPTSAFILTYDEYGGLFDHVTPITVPPPDNIAPILEPGKFDTNPYPNGDFAHSGFRLPVIVISPWVKPHYVSHVPRDTTSILKFIETRFGLPSLTARDAWADNMLEFFDFSHPAMLTVPSIPDQPTNGTCDFNKELDGSQ